MVVAGERSIPALMRDAEALLDQVRSRVGDTTKNKPLGAIAEAAAAVVYDCAAIVNKSTKGYDVIAHDGRRIQVKARQLATLSGQMFSQQFHGDYDAVLLAVFTPDYEVWWAVELDHEQAVACSTEPRAPGKSLAGARHIKVAAAHALLTSGAAPDMTQRVRAAIEQM